ncbi:Protein of unknown function precursor containing a C-terminal secretion signal. Putative adhesin [Tenacibaculum maritimum]|nr:Protein of unknown function precursor containing a C-terminal secretion signal. Putative adhesin [Tenacibaculum maritimum]
MNVPANTPAGNYQITYQICEKLNPTNCDTATVDITVGASTIVANDDNFNGTTVNGLVGGVAGNALTNDTLNGVAVVAGDLNITTTANGENITVGADGSVNVPANTPAGNYQITYQICEKLNPTNCDTATVIVTVNVTPDAVDDTEVTTEEGVSVEVDIYDNDNDIPTDGDLTTTDPENGTVTIDDGGTPNDPSDDIVTYTPDEGFTGTDTFDYTICDNASPANCSTATVTVEVTKNLDTCVVVFNEFSPNGDGINDYLKIECIEKFKDNTVEIFNRWGNTVYSVKGYSNNDPNNRFEGISNGRANIQVEKKLPVGTYFYVLDLGNGSPLRKGWIYINR